MTTDSEKIIDKKEQDIIDDYNFSRHNYYTLIKKSLEIIDKIQELADDTEHPRVYEALATIIKNTGDMNDKFVNLQRKKQVIDEASEAKKLRTPKELETENNNPKIGFVGSTDELLKSIEDAEYTEEK